MNEKQIKETNEEPINIFTIWLTDEEWGAMPYIYEICIASWQVLNPNSTITIYSNHNLHLSFLDRTITKVKLIQDEFGDLYERASKITSNKAHQSDIIRFTILSKMKGIYLDTDVILNRSIEKLYQTIQQSGKSIMLPLEDANMICNAFLMRTNMDGNDFFTDVLLNYHNRYIKHSYLFNSQKYMQLMSRRYTNDIYLLDCSIFYPTWRGLDNEMEIFLNNDKNIECIDDCKIDTLAGFGFHLYSSVKNWDNLRAYMDKHIYDKNPDTYLAKLASFIIDKYIDLMKEADYEE